LLSYDEGLTWAFRKTIYPGASAYSSLCVLNDGTIGMYYEVGEYETYQMYFARFSLDWVTSGTDTWTEKWINFNDVATEIIENGSDYTIYPNPAEEVMNVTGKFDNNTVVEVYNMQGALMNTIRVEDSRDKIQISLLGYTSGIYFLKIGEATLRFVVR